MSGFDPARFKQLERAGYNLIAGRYAEGARAREALSRALVDWADLAPGQRLLDVASGPGLLARLAAERLGGGLVVASDIAEALLAEGRRLCAADARPPAFAAADAERLPFADASLDRVLCGLGLMFFPHAEAALAEARRVLAPGGVLALSVWGEEGEAPLVACALACLRRVLPPAKVERPSVFRFGRPAQLRAMLEQAGFAGVAVQPCRLESAFPDADAYWQAFLDLAGGAAGALARLPQELQERLPREVARELAPYRAADGYRLESLVWLARATA